MSAYAGSSANKPIDPRANNLDLEITRLLVENGKLEKIDCVRFRLGLRWRYLMNHVPLALDYLCQQELISFDLADILLSSLVETPMASVLPDGQLDSFLSIALEHGQSTLTSFSHQGEAFVLGILPIYLSETFENAKLQKEILNEAVISVCMLLSHGFGSPPKPLTEDFLRKVSDTVNRDPDFMKVVWKLALDITRRTPWCSREINQGANGVNDSFGSEFDKLATSSAHAAPLSKDDLADQQVPGAWIDGDRRSEIPKTRKFRSIPGDFDGTIWGHKWDPKTYLI